METATPTLETRPLLSVASVLTGAPAPADAAVHVRYFTDPLSAWCWGTEPAWLHLTERFGPLLSLDLRMAGLIQSLEEITGSENAFNRPDQIAMQWEEVAHFTGMPLDSDVWFDAPPASSWPACAAVKAAQAQDPTVAERYLRRLREAAVCRAENVADPEVLTRLAGEIGLDVARLESDLASGAAGDAFNQDLILAAETGSVSTPSFFFFGPAGVSEVRGARSFEDLVQALCQAAGAEVAPVADPRAAPDRHAYVVALAQSRGSIAAAEVGEVLGIDRVDAEDLLARMAASGQLVRDAVGRSALYRPV